MFSSSFSFWNCSGDKVVSGNNTNRDVIGIFEIPGALPITGHLLELGDDHATVCEVCWSFSFLFCSCSCFFGGHDYYHHYHHILSTTKPQTLTFSLSLSV